LGVETSCDETGVAVVCERAGVLGEALHSQWALHLATRGVHPMHAAREHAAQLPGVLTEALRRAGLSSVREVDAVAVTAGPGLAPCLQQGVTFAARLAREAGRPLVAVNHLEAHLLVTRMPPAEAPPQFPFAGLLVSGGHTQLVLARGVGRYELLGATLDDAVGEAFDKVARLLALPRRDGEAAGAALERAVAEAAAVTAAPRRFSVPLQGVASLDFSFSGLKSMVRRAVDALGPAPSHAQRVEIAADFQRACGDHLAQRVRRALRSLAARDSPLVRARGGAPLELVVAGGVACNAYLRQRVAEAAARSPSPVRVVFAPPRLCGDNGVMVAWAGAERVRLGLADAHTVSFDPAWALGPRAAAAGRVGL
jgi:N6-L-threonylcarbamoyladenine synthase